MLTGDTASYGVGAEKKKHKYIIKYFTRDCKQISADKIFITKAKSLAEQKVDEYWSKRKDSKYYDENYTYKKIYFYEKISGKYIKSDEVEYDKLAISECYLDGFCKVYPIYRKEYYIKKENLYSY